MDRNGPSKSLICNCRVACRQCAVVEVLARFRLWDMDWTGHVRFSIIKPDTDDGTWRGW